MGGVITSSGRRSKSTGLTPKDSAGRRHGGGGPAGQRQDLPEAVAGKAQAFLSQLAVMVASAVDDPKDVSARVKSWVSILSSKRLVTESRQDMLAAEVLKLLQATGAKAKPVLRVLFARVGQAGRLHGGYHTAAAMFMDLGFTDAASLHQNRVTKDDAAAMLLAACDHLPVVVTAAMNNV